MKRTWMVISLIALSSVAAVYAGQDAHQKDEFNDWKNKPIEKFSDAEANFNAAKKQLLEKYYDSKLSSDALYEAATRGMLQALNPNDQEDWNKLYSPSELRELQADLKGDVTGVGVAIKMNDETGTCSVVQVIPHSAAESAGVKAGDQIVSINGKISKGLQLRDLVYAIRGKVGESVKLKLLRGDEILTKKIAREKINWSPVESNWLDHKVALIKLRYFSEKSASLLKTALEKANSEHATGIIFDLREDEGGLFDQAVDSAKFFAPKGRNVARVETRGGAEKLYTATEEPLVKNIPVILLVSPKTSSGAELFAGSLNENVGAKIVGEKTHGKWSVQTLENLPNGFAVKFTISIFKTPNGKTYGGVGLEADVPVTGPKEIPLFTTPSETLEKDETLRTAYHLLNSAT